MFIFVVDVLFLSDVVNLKGKIFIYYLCDMVEKQWVEICVLMLSGVVCVFNNWCQILVGFDEFLCVWVFFLEFVEFVVLSKFVEVVLVVFKSFQDIV